MHTTIHMHTLYSISFRHFDMYYASFVILPNKSIGYLLQYNSCILLYTPSEYIPKLGARGFAPGTVRVPGVKFPRPDAAEQRVVRQLDGVLQETDV